MSNDKNTALIPQQSQTVGQLANYHAGRAAFDEYLSRRADNTIKRQTNDLQHFADFLAQVDIQTTGYALQHEPDSWHGITWGLIKGFINWQLQQGYAVGTVNVRLATLKAYARLANQAGVIDAQEYAMIKTVQGYSKKEVKRIDEKRDTTRRGEKKANHTSITPQQARALKSQPDTPQGRRDRVIMCLLLDHGLRVGELAALTVDSVNIPDGTFSFYRQKVDKVQTHKMTSDTLLAVKKWLDLDAPAIGPLLRGSRKGGKLTSAGMSERAITARVKVLGEQLGIEKLSAHDCRHYWATQASRNGTDTFALQEAGGWSGLEMPRRYVEAARIANEGVII